MVSSVTDSSVDGRNIESKEVRPFYVLNVFMLLYMLIVPNLLFSYTK